MAKQAPPETPQAESPQPEIPSTPPARHTHRFFLWIRSLGLVRQPGWVGGVSAGIADRLGIDVVIVRGILVVVAVLGGPAVLLYALAWLVLPDNKGDIHLEDLMHGKIETPVIGIAILIALSLLPIAQGFWWFGSLYWGSPRWGDSVGRAIWTLVILGLVAWLVVWFARRRSNPSIDREPANGPDAAATATPTTVAEPAATTASTTAEPIAPPAPLGPDASAEELAAWRASQEQWKADHDAYRRQQLEQRRATAQAAADAAQAERTARAAAYRERRRRTRSHPLYSAALIGAALLAGAATTLWLGDGAPTPVQWLIGDAVAVGVLGAGVILNGALGHRDGGASGMAVLLALVLLVAGVFPQTPTRHYFGDLSVAPAQVGGANQDVVYLQGFGSVHVDLSSYYPTPRPAYTKKALGPQSFDQVDILVASGNVTVILPTDEYAYIDAATAGGHITTADGRTVRGEYATDVTVDGDKDAEHAVRELDIDVHVLHGNITFIEQGADR